MLGFGAHQRYYIYKGAVDMRKGSDGLSGLVRNELGADPLSGDVYISILVAGLSNYWYGIGTALYCTVNDWSVDATNNSVVS